MFLLKKNNFVSTLDMRQSKKLFTINERGSEIATTIVVASRDTNGNGSSVSYYFWSTYVDVLTFSIAAYPV